jgi:hypothetical protein
MFDLQQLYYADHGRLGTAGTVVCTIYGVQQSCRRHDCCCYCHAAGIYLLRWHRPMSERKTIMFCNAGANMRAAAISAHLCRHLLLMMDLLVEKVGLALCCGRLVTAAQRTLMSA